MQRNLTEGIWRTLAGKSVVARTSQLVIFFLFFCLFYFLAMLFVDDSNFPMIKILSNPWRDSRLHCVNGTMTTTCPADYYPKEFKFTDQSPSTPPGHCPDYFRWIYEDLRPWKDTGITLEMVERANRTANFRLVVINGRAYVEIYQKAFQTRDTFTLWGILQLLRRYPGKIPDLDLMFDCVDWPVVKTSDYPQGPNAVIPPPLFRYCGDANTLDIVFPDWSFWGWPETNIKPWERLSKEIKAGTEKIMWKDRDPHAYWKGNPIVAEKRMQLLKCNVSDEHEWNARIYVQNWTIAQKQGFKKSGLADQCNHRYKIYIEGSAWSVSEKYILACDSVTLLVTPLYYDFFTRGLMPMRHYWPIREGEEEKCKSIKFAVEWGNNHQEKVQEIGKAAAKFIQEDLKMEYVYDYMFHLLNEYAKLLRYKPSVPPRAVELCSETMACPAQGLTRNFMMESLVKSKTNITPCTIPPSFDPLARDEFLKKKDSIMKQMEEEERKYWDQQSQQA